MINLDSVKRVCIVASFEKRDLVKQVLAKSKEKKISVTFLPTDHCEVNEHDSFDQLRKKLEPIVNLIDHSYKKAIQKELSNSKEDVPAEHNTDPRILFLIDTSNKTGTALARLFQGPLVGSFTAKYTIVGNFSS